MKGERAGNLSVVAWSWMWCFLVAAFSPSRNKPMCRGFSIILYHNHHQKAKPCSLNWTEIICLSFLTALQANSSATKLFAKYIFLFPVPPHFRFWWTFKNVCVSVEFRCFVIPYATSALKPKMSCEIRVLKIAVPSNQILSIPQLLFKEIVLNNNRKDRQN